MREEKEWETVQKEHRLLQSGKKQAKKHQDKQV